MTLEKLNCPACGSVLEHLPAKGEVMKCSYCSSLLMQSENPSQLHIIHNNRISIRNSSVFLPLDSVTIDVTAENIRRNLENADYHLDRFRDYNKAKALYLSVVEADAGEHRAWWGIVRSMTENFSKYALSDSEHEELNIYVKRAVLSAPDSRKEDLRQVIRNYYNNVRNFKTDKQQEHRRKQEQLNEIISRYLNQINSINSKINALNVERRNKIRQRKRFVMFAPYITACAVILQYLGVAFITYNISAVFHTEKLLSFVFWGIFVSFLFTFFVFVPSCIQSTSEKQKDDIKSMLKEKQTLKVQKELYSSEVVRYQEKQKNLRNQSMG